MDNDHSITDPLRRFITDPLLGYASQSLHIERLTAIADRIDAAHEEAIQREHESAYDKGYDEGFASADDWLADHEDAMAEHGWVKLPVDADGKPWHIGDFTESGQLVYKMYLDVNGWSFYGLVNDIDPSIHRHYHEDTWERIIEDACKRAVDGYPDETGVIATSDLIERCKALAAEGGDAK